MHYPECRKYLARGSLAVHRQTQHGVAKGGSGQENDKEFGGDDTRTFRVAFLEKSELSSFPVEGCSGQAATWMSMRIYFWHRTVRDTVVILDEGNLPRPRCPMCDIMVPWRILNALHKCTAQ